MGAAAEPQPTTVDLRSIIPEHAILDTYRAMAAEEESSAIARLIVLENAVLDNIGCVSGSHSAPGVVAECGRKTTGDGEAVDLYVILAVNEEPPALPLRVDNGGLGARLTAQDEFVSIATDMDHGVGR